MGVACRHGNIQSSVSLQYMNSACNVAESPGWANITVSTSRAPSSPRPILNRERALSACTEHINLSPGGTAGSVYTFAQ